MPGRSRRTSSSRDHSCSSNLWCDESEGLFESGEGGAEEVRKESIKKERHPFSRVQKELANEEGSQVPSASLFWVLPLASCLKLHQVDPVPLCLPLSFYKHLL